MSTSGRTVTSDDGTTIAYERAGIGPALILVDAAGHYREFSSFGGLIGLLAADFTVYHYDRRGRGGSTDNPPYAVRRSRGPRRADRRSRRLGVPVRLLLRRAARPACRGERTHDSQAGAA